MSRKIKMRVRVMRYAHHIYHNSERSWRESLVTAWELYHLKQALLKGRVKFYYKKKDGVYRVAFGTLALHLKTVSKKAENLTVLTYYDLERNAFRCFKIENFLYMSTWGLR